MKQENIEMNPEIDLDWGELLERLSSEKAYKFLRNGTNNQISAKFEKFETVYITGCRKCNIARKGKFCMECGSELTAKLEQRKSIGTQWITLTYSNTDKRLLISDTHPHSSIAGFKECNMSLQYFMSIKYWYKRAWK